MDTLFFNSWDSVFRTLIIGVFSYIGLVLMLRISGNRTLSQLNAFDFIVTVALGSTLATVILNKSISLADGLIALGMLILLQYTVSSLSVRWETLRGVIKTEPFVLVYRGKFLPDALKKHRITEDEVLQMLRSEGIGNVTEVDAVVLETNGNFSVIKKTDQAGDSTLKNVSGHHSDKRSD